MANFTNPKTRGETTDDDPAIHLSLTQLQDLIAGAVAAAQASTGTGDLAKAITDGMAQVKEPIPENKVAPGVSQQNPLGEQDAPRPGLKCQMWWGVITDPTPNRPSQIKRFSEVMADDLTAWEQLAWNLLQPADDMITMLDGMPIRVRVSVTTHEVTGAIEQVIFAVPMRHIQKGSETKNMIPPITDVLRQLQGIDLSPRTLPLATLQSLMAKHRSREYVAA